MANKKSLTPEQAEKKARQLLSSISLSNLLAQWELTTITNHPNIPTVRGWIMAEIERRNPEGYNKWLEEDFANDSSLRKYVS